MSNCKHFPDADDHCLVCEKTRPSDIVLPEGWTWDRVEYERAKHKIGDNMVPVATASGVAVAWITINAARADQAEIDEPEEHDAPKAPFWTVAIYRVDLAYGGPEEGGWYYQCGERVDREIEGLPTNLLLTVWRTEELASDVCKNVQTLLDVGINKGRREISSVLSDGRYDAQVHNGHPPHHYPETRPHYE